MFNICFNSSLTVFFEKLLLFIVLKNILLYSLFLSYCSFLLITISPITIFPLFGFIIPDNISSNVVFPEPFFPIIPTTLFFSIFIFILSNILFSFFKY